jgi:DNA-binding LacI/PurR family transcriptional regulator
MRANQVEGIIIFPVSNLQEDETVFELYKDNFPFVLVDRYFPGLDCSYVVSDNFGGGYRATEHLLILEHTQIAFLYHPDADFRTTSVRDRYLGYRKALEKYNIDFDPTWAVPVENQLSVSEDEAQLCSYIEFLKKPKRPDAVFSVNDNTAIGLLTAANRLGIAVPAELAIVGFDNLRLTAQVVVPVTTINVHRTELGREAANLLIDQIEGISTRESIHIVLPTELVVRESCGARQRIRNSRVESGQALSLGG